MTRSTYFVTCPKGLVELLASEVSELKVAVTRRAPAGVWIDATVQEAFSICLWSRLASRVIRHLGLFDAASADDLKSATASLAWEDWLEPGMCFRVTFQGTDERIRNSHFGAQCIKDGIMDRMAAAGKPRPGTAGNDPDLPVHARLHRRTVTLGVDLVGESLHRRGYRENGGRAPLRENLAAALLYRAGWPELARAGADLEDPLCGSGTLLIEGAMMATDTAPGLLRHFAFQRWPWHDAITWASLRRDALRRREAGLNGNQSRCRGSDRDRRVVGSAWENIERAGLADCVHVEKIPLSQWSPPATATAGLILTNPPYGKRLGADGKIAELYRALGERARQCAEGWRLAVFTALPEMGHQIGIRSHRQYPLFSGALEASLLLFEVQPEQYRMPQRTPEDIADGRPLPRIHDQERARMLANRLRKNRRALRKRLRDNPEGRYRLYDADIPEFAVRVVWESGWIRVWQYPSSGRGAQWARKRLAEALAVLPEALGVSEEAVHFCAETPGPFTA